MVGVLAVVLMWVLACMGLECWLDGLWGVQGAGMLAGGNASLVVLPGEKPPNCATSLWNIGTWTMLVVE